MKSSFGKSIIEKRFSSNVEIKKSKVKDSVVEYCGAEKLSEILEINNKKISNSKDVEEEELTENNCIAQDLIEMLDMTLSIPPRVPYKGFTKEQYKEIELCVFNEWKRRNSHFIFERNLEIWRQFWITCERSDVIVQIIDSRNPKFFINDDIMKMYKDKKYIILSNKSDLTDIRIEVDGYEIHYYSAIEDNDVLKYLVGLEYSNIGFVGYPNVGKSSTINAILKSKKVKVSQTPGKTKYIQTIELCKKKNLIDCPGLVFPKHKKIDLLLHGVLNVDTILDLKSSLYEIINFIGIGKLTEFYNLPRFYNDSRYPGEYNFLNNMAEHKQWSIIQCLKNIVKDLVSGNIQYEKIEEKLKINLNYDWTGSI